MKRFRIFIIVFVIGLQVICSNAKVMACMGTPCPDCCRTAWLAKFSPSVVLFPSTGVPITVPINMVPFVSWITSQKFGCPSPTGASITATLICTPAGGGAPITIGPMTFSSPTVPTPTTPGVQSLVSVPFTIPAGTFATVVPQICTVVATYTVDFGGDSITGTGDTNVCLVPPSVADPDLPELNMERVELNGEKFVTCLKGDQTTLFYSIENNDPDRSVTLDITALTAKVSGMPTSSDPDDKTLFAVSDPDDNTDNFPISFSDIGDPGEMIELPDPLNNDSNEISRQITIDPMGITIIPIDIRSWGMCADGSCCDNIVKAVGNWSDGGPALACAGTAVVVGDAKPKSALCDVQDAVKSSPNSDIDWRMAEFGTADGPFIAASTFFNGQSTSQNIENFDSEASEIIRTDLPPTAVTWGASGFANFPDDDLFFQSVDLSVNAVGLTSELPCAVPIVSFGNDFDSNLRLDIDMGADTISVFDMSDAFVVTLAQDIFTDVDGDGVGDLDGDSFTGEEEVDGSRIEGGFLVGVEDGCDCVHLHGTIFIDGKGPFFDPNPPGCGFGCVVQLTDGGTDIFSGPFSSFIETPPTGFHVDHDTCRTVNITCPPPPGDMPVLTVDPRGFADTLNVNDSQSLDFEILNARNQQPVPWNASGSESGITIDSSSGNAGTKLVINIDPSMAPLFPETVRGSIEISNDNAFDKIFLPVLLRNSGVTGEICDNGIDDDGDGLIDNDDPDCLPKIEICDDGIDNDDDGLIDSADPDCQKRFRFNCTNNFTEGHILDLEKLIMELGSNEPCTLKLTNLEPGTQIEISTNLRTMVKPSITVEPSSGMTDENGELEFTISAVGKGTDWIAWALPDENGETEFSKKAYDNGSAWGMFVDVK